MQGIGTALVLAIAFWSNTTLANFDLPEPTKEICTNAKFMSSLGHRMATLHDSNELLRHNNFIIRCRNVLAPFVNNSSGK